MKITKLLIADDHNIVRQGIVNIIEEYSEFSVVAEAENGEGVIEKYEKFKPDIIVTDISMPKLTGLNAAKKILSSNVKARILFLTVHESEEYIYKAHQLGACGLLNKNILKGELISALRIISEGGKYFAGLSADELTAIVKRYGELSKSKSSDSSVLTEKEKEILLMIAKGFTSEEIAGKIFLSKRTVDAHRASIMAKLDLKSLPQLIKYAIEFSYSQGG